MIKKFIALIAFCIIACVHLQAQNIKFYDDSVAAEIQASSNLEFKVDRLYFLGFLIMDSGSKLDAVKLFDSADVITRQVNYDKGFAYSNFNKGVKAWIAGDSDIAENTMVEAINDMDNLGIKFNLYSPLSCIRLFYNETRQYEKKLRFYQERFDFYKQNGVDENFGCCYHGMGNYYNIAGFPEKAIEYYSKAMENWSEHNNTLSALAMQIVLAQNYRNWGNSNYSKKLMKNFAEVPTIKMPYISYVIYKRLAAAHNIDELNYAAARDHFLDLENYKSKMGQVNQLINYIDLARIYLLLGNADSAKMYIDILIPVLSTGKFPLWNANGDMEYEFYLARYYLFTGKKQLAYEKMQGALATAKSEKYSKLILKYLHELSTLADALGKTSEAYRYLSEYNQLKDSLDNAGQATRIALYETELKEREISVLNKDNEVKQAEISKQKTLRNSFFGGFAIVLIFAGVFFSQRNKIREGKKRSDELLLNILPEEVAEELKHKGSSDAKQFDEVTVLFTDFKNFTQLSGQLSARELVEEINYCYSNFDKIITEFGVEKIKTIGDAYMCAGGLPVPDGEHAIKTVQAALAIRDFMIAEKLKREKMGQSFFEIRIGLHSGPVVAGIVGIKKFAYDIWGDTVNIASRMESSGAEGMVNVSETTYKLIKDKFKCEHRGKIAAKNKGDIDMFFINRSLGED